MEEINESSNMIMAVFLDSNYEVGFSALDMASSSLTTGQFADNHSYDKLVNKVTIVEPTEIILSNSLFDLALNPVINTIKNNFDGVKITTFQKRFFKYSKGLEFIKRLCICDSKNLVELSSKMLSISSCAGLISYMEMTRNFLFLPNSIRIQFETVDKITIIDSTTTRYLELLNNSRDIKSKTNLFGILNRTKTKSGRRALKTNLLQPSCDQQLIEDKLELTRVFRNDRNLVKKYKNIIKNFQYLEEIVSFCYQLSCQKKYYVQKSPDAKITKLLQMKSILDSVKLLKELMKDDDTKLIKHYYKELFTVDKFEIIYNEIDKVFMDDCTVPRELKNTNMQKCYAIKTGINGYLDVFRRTYSECIQDINRYSESIYAKYNLAAKLSFNQTRGYFLTLSLKKLSMTLTNSSYSSVFSTESKKIIDKLPKEFVRLTRLKTSVRFTTEELIRKNEIADDLCADIFKMADTIISELIHNIKDNFECFYVLNECISTIDMHAALAEYANNESFCEPLFRDIIHLKDCYHPMLRQIRMNSLLSKKEIMNYRDRLVNNSFSVMNGESLILVNGANMSGKSTFLKQIGSIQIMAQFGSYIPASNAYLPVRTQIFSLPGDNGDTSFKESSFEQSMNEMSYIIHNMGKKSLVLIDELGRNTNHYEGLSVSFAICEYLLIKLHQKEQKSLILFANHYSELNYLKYLYPNVKVVNLHSELDDKRRIKHSYEINTDENQIQNYGLKSVELVSMPTTVLQDLKICPNSLTDKLGFKINILDQKHQLFLNFYQTLYSNQNSIDQISDYELVNKMEMLQMNLEDRYSKLIDLN